MACFDQEQASSDGGAVLLKACDERSGLNAAMAACLQDDRQRAKVEHAYEEIFRQRMSEALAGSVIRRHRRRKRKVKRITIDLDPTVDATRGGRQLVDPSTDVFNIHRAIEDPLFTEHGQLVIVEDLAEAFQALNKNNKNAVATMQGVPTEQQILRLKSLDVPRKAFSVMWSKPRA